MITILRRGQNRKKKIANEEDLKCNGSKKPKKPKRVTGENLPLGICYICQSSKKLIKEVTEFLKEGKIPDSSSGRE